MWLVQIVLLLALLDSSLHVEATCPVLSALGTNSIDLGLQPDEDGEWKSNFLLPGSQQEKEWRMQQKRARDLRRYDHYNSGSAYEYRSRNGPPSYSTLADIWLCLACALGWTVWLVGATRSQNPMESASVFESQDSKTVHGNVLQVTLGEDADGTGIPIYHALVDYVVSSSDPEEEPLQVRKCFSTAKLLEEGFANVEVLVLVDDPTTSILMDDFVLSQTDRVKQQMEPPSLLWSAGVYVGAGILIITSLVGGFHAFIKLHPEQVKAGKISLGVGTVLLYPVALIVYQVIHFVNQWSIPLRQRPGVIIHGARDYWKRKCGATLNPLEIMGTFDSDAAPPPRVPSPPVAQGVASTFDSSAGTHLRSHRQSDTKARTQNMWPSGLELPEMQTTDKKSPSLDFDAPISPRYPNAGCGFGNYNVNVPGPRGGIVKNESAGGETSSAGGDLGTAGYDLSTISVSSMSSATGGNQSNDSSTQVTGSQKARQSGMDTDGHHGVMANAFAVLRFPAIMGGTSQSTLENQKESYEPPMMMQEAYSSESHSVHQGADRASALATPLANNLTGSAATQGAAVGVSTSSSGSLHQRRARANTPSSQLITDSIREEEEEEKKVNEGAVEPESKE